jgi:hypothetical protein
LKCCKGRKNPDDRRKWYKCDCTNGDPEGFDPYKWEIFEVNDALSEIKA